MNLIQPYNTNERRQRMKNTSHLFRITLIAAFAVLFLSGSALATNSIFTAWKTKYGTSAPSGGAGCQLCHRASSGGDPWNAYGWAIQQRINVNGDSNANAILNVESANSDGDPGSNSNVTEIIAGAQPGWTVGAHGRSTPWRVKNDICI